MSTILRNMINRAAGPDRPWCLFFKWFTDSHDSSVLKLLSECHCCITEELLRTSIRISLVRCQSDVGTIALVPFTPYAMCRYGEHDFILFGSHSIAKFAEFGPCAFLVPIKSFQYIGARSRLFKQYRSSLGIYYTLSKWRCQPHCDQLACLSQSYLPNGCHQVLRLTVPITAGRCIASLLFLGGVYANALGAVPPLVFNDALSLTPFAENELLRTYTLPTRVIRFVIRVCRGFPSPKK